jgi:alanine racemase
MSTSNSSAFMLLRTRYSTHFESYTITEDTVFLKVWNCFKIARACFFEIVSASSKPSMSTSNSSSIMLLRTRYSTHFES